MAMEIARSTAAVRAAVGSWRSEGNRVALVPTMGALHEGHLSLLRLALERAEHVVVSIFVNPTQFGPGEDFSAYPRPEERDLALLREAGVHLAYLPTPEVMYPEGFATTVSVARLSEGLCGAFRPGHFQGVATVVAKLLLQVGPDLALFGEKDYQQLQVIRRMVRDLDLPVEIVGGPTLREPDGLAMSSRNAYLSEPERRTAPLLHATLQGVGASLRAGAPAAPALEAARETLLMGGFASVDYVELRDAADLAPMNFLDRPARLLAAARLGRARLIDNIALAPG